MILKGSGSMIEAIQRTTPVDPRAQEFAGVSITLAAPLARFSLRAKDSALLGKLIGRDLPARIGQVAGEVACLGPDEWLLRAAEGTELPSCQGQPVSIADVSERSVCIVVEGPAALKVLSSGCPRDLSRLGVGQAARTVFETVEMIVVHEAADRYAVDVWRSFAPWLHAALVKAAGHLH